MSRDGALAVSTLHYSDEIAPPAADRASSATEATKEEINTVKKSIQGMMSAFTLKNIPIAAVKSSLKSLPKRKEKSRGRSARA